jgi:hypothetical protein
MLASKASGSAVRQSRSLLLLSVTVLTLSQSQALYAGHPGTNPRPSNNTAVVQTKATTSSMSLLSEIRREYERMMAIIRARLSPGPH